MEKKELLYRSHGSVSSTKQHIGEKNTNLGEKEGVNIIQLGGTYRRDSRFVIGSYTLSFLKNVTCLKFFLGVDGIDIDFGVSDDL